MRRWLAVLIPLALIVVMSSLGTSSSGAAEQEYTPVERTSDTKVVYIEQLNTLADGNVLFVDEIEWYEGEEAEQAFLEHEPDAGIDGPPDGYYIVNEDIKLTSYRIAEDVRIFMQIYDRTGNIEDMDIRWNELVTMEQFKGIVQNTEWIDVKDFPYHITVKDGTVVQIVQQYIP
ncbi:hypothetical protein EIM92_05805 [Paenibacillus lentus]|uniref:DUF4309 domain-containing protein n=2 Tax=Paenibacillus lentus TaxID=1338368 RepID=A0A3Q8SEK9_9BACL|nr:hypothetical protein EIM92_05805 [Paenibacillus lentus]